MNEGETQERGGTREKERRRGEEILEVALVVEAFVVAPIVEEIVKITVVTEVFPVVVKLPVVDTPIIFIS